MRSRAPAAAAILLFYLLSGIWRGFLSDPARAAVFSAVVLTIELAAAWQIAGIVGQAARPEGRGTIRLARRGSLLAVALTLVAIVNCSASGVITPSGTGLQVLAREPGHYTLTLLVISGPLLLLLAAPAALLAGPNPSPRRLRAGIAVSALSALVALMTGYAGFILSMAVLCVPDPTPVQHAQCVAGAGTLAAVFGVLGSVFVIPSLLLHDRRRPVPPGPGA